MVQLVTVSNIFLSDIWANGAIFALCVTRNQIESLKLEFNEGPSPPHAPQWNRDLNVLDFFKKGNKSSIIRFSKKIFNYLIKPLPNFLATYLAIALLWQSLKPSISRIGSAPIGVSASIEKCEHVSPKFNLTQFIRFNNSRGRHFSSSYSALISLNNTRVLLFHICQ